MSNSAAIHSAQSVTPANVRCVSLLFHDVTDEPETSGFRQPSAQRYKHSVSQFLSYLSTISDCGFRLPLAGQDLQQLEDRIVLPTFDDGGASAIQIADLLENHGGIGLFFITTDLLNTPGFLKTSEVVELVDRGHMVGSHSCSHPDVFRSLSTAAMQEEWNRSCDTLQQLLQRPIDIASVPGGDVDTRTFETAQEAGLQHVFTSEPTLNTWSVAGVTAWGRLMMVDTTSSVHLSRWLNYPHIGLWPQQISRWSKSTIKKGLGPVYRKMMQRRRAGHTFIPAVECFVEGVVSDTDLPPVSNPRQVQRAVSKNTNERPSESRPIDQVAACKPIPNKQGSRVVALINPTLHTRSTCADLISAGVNLVGIVEADNRTAGLPLRTLQRLVRQNGIKQTASSVVARLAARFAEGADDKRAYSSLFDAERVTKILDTWAGPVLSCADYADRHVMTQLAEWQPDILVVHSQSWVTKKVRQLARSGLVLGGHPGITPDYRGSHSPFWAIANGRPDQVGWTAFHVEQGVDTGDVIVQGRIQVNDDDSFMALNWKGMKEIAAALADAILTYDATGHINRDAHDKIPDGSNYGQPSWSDWRRYRRTRRIVNHD